MPYLFQPVQVRVIYRLHGLFTVYSHFVASLPYFSLLQKKSDGHRPSLSCWRYLSFRAVSSQVLWAEASLTSVFGMGTGGPSP